MDMCIVKRLLIRQKSPIDPNVVLVDLHNDFMVIGHQVLVKDHMRREPELIFNILGKAVYSGVENESMKRHLIPFFA